MNFREYQIKCRKSDVGTSAQDCIEPGWLYYVLGIAGESGEFCEKIKKLFRDKKGIIDQEFKDAVIKELGDIQWYMARIADQFDINLDDVAKANIEKLLGRIERKTIHGDGDNR
ncbi:MAG: nucleoside triphosphate pyrophosphohydrolase family protein [Candidatus Thorarchaeota archaeon]